MVAQAQPACRVGVAPAATVVDALRAHLDDYLRQHRSDPEQRHVLRTILACRTPALGLHGCVCHACGWSGYAFNSCRNRHCPQCQGRQTKEWLEGQRDRMLPTPHFQVVFTLPAALRRIARANPKQVYGLLFKAATSVLSDLAAQKLEARLGVTAILHTWATDLSYHPHIHCLVTGGGLSLDDARWVASRDNYLFPQRVMGEMFKGRVKEGLLAAHDEGELRVPDGAAPLRPFLRRLSRRHRRWVVHVEPPHDRPVEHVARYLARYVKRVAISDARMVAVTRDQVVFRSRQGLITLPGHEFVRRFAQHMLRSTPPDPRRCTSADTLVQQPWRSPRQVTEPRVTTR